MDQRKKPQRSDEEAAPRPALLPPSAESPFRPLSRRRRQQQRAEPTSAVERPHTSLVFDASPTRIAAVLAKAGGSPAEPVRLVWNRNSDASAPVAGDDIDVEPPRPTDAA